MRGADSDMGSQTGEHRQGGSVWFSSPIHLHGGELDNETYTSPCFWRAAESCDTRVTSLWDLDLGVHQCGGRTRTWVPGPVSTSMENRSGSPLGSTWMGVGLTMGRVLPSYLRNTSPVVSQGSWGRACIGGESAGCCGFIDFGPMGRSLQSLDMAHSPSDCG